MYYVVERTQHIEPGTPIVRDLIPHPDAPMPGAGHHRRLSERELEPLPDPLRQELRACSGKPVTYRDHYDPFLPEDGCLHEPGCGCVWFVPEEEARALPDLWEATVRWQNGNELAKAEDEAQRAVSVAQDAAFSESVQARIEEQLGFTAEEVGGPRWNDTEVHHLSRPLGAEGPGWDLSAYGDHLRRLREKRGL